jgi:3-oxoacyl-[acyl-carrier-protein] synthase-3
VTNPSFIGVRGIGSALPARFVPLQQLALRSSVEVLAGFGFTGAAVAEDLDVLLLDASRQALSNASASTSQIDALFHISALATGHVRSSASPQGGVLDSFCYRASWLQDSLELDGATVTAIAQQGCAGMFSALRQARALLFAEPELRNILCVGGDCFGATTQREILYNVVSDAACAVVVSRESGWAQWLAYSQITKGYYWDVPAREAELIAAYFPTARAVVMNALAQANLRPKDVDLVIPTGVNPASWPILLSLCGLSDKQLYQPQLRFGHTIAADSFIYLNEARARGLLTKGMRVLLFTYGFGSSWCALVLEITEEMSS